MSTAPTQAAAGGGTSSARGAHARQDIKRAAPETTSTRFALEQRLRAAETAAPFPPRQRARTRAGAARLAFATREPEPPRAHRDQLTMRHPRAARGPLRYNKRVVEMHDGVKKYSERFGSPLVDDAGQPVAAEQK